PNAGVSFALAAVVPPEHPLAAEVVKVFEARLADDKRRLSTDVVGHHRLTGDLGPVLRGLADEDQRVPIGIAAALGPVLLPHAADRLRQLLAAATKPYFLLGYAWWRLTGEVKPVLHHLMAVVQNRWAFDPASVFALARI